MTRDEALRAMTELASHPAARHIGSRADEPNQRIVRVCTICGASESLQMPMPLAYLKIPAMVPPNLDATLYHWMRAFQDAHTHETVS